MTDTDQYNAELVRRLQAEDALRVVARAVEAVLIADEKWTGEIDDIAPLSRSLSELRRCMNWTSIRSAVDRPTS